MNVWNELLNAVDSGVKYNIDLKDKTIRIGKRYLVKDGKTNIELGLSKTTTDQVLFELERLYGIYKISVPSERSENKRKKYFKAKALNELTNEEMWTGLSRDFAQAQLEAYLLLSVLNGSLVWTDDLGKWYWHGSDPNLIVLKEWCV